MKQISKLCAAILAVVFAASSFCFGLSALGYVTAGTEGETTASESYKKSKYYTYLTDVELTGDNPTDIIAVALSQLGYKESDTLDDLSGMADGDGNFTEYNNNFGDFSEGYGYYWCASFASFCLLQSGATNLNKLKDWCRDHSGDEAYIWRELGCEKWRSALTKFGYFKTSKAHKNTISLMLRNYYDPDYIPGTADLIFFTDSPFKTASHVGFVLYVDGDTIYTIEGNTDLQSEVESNGDGVYIKSYDINDPKITGFGDMPYKTDPTVKKIDYSGKNPSIGLYMSTEDIKIYETKDAAAAGDERIAKSTVSEYSMISVNRVYDDGLFYVQTAIDGKISTGYIKGAGKTIQLSTTPAELHVPENETPKQQQSNSGCGSSVAGFAIIPVTLAACGACVVKKKKRKN